VIVPEHNNISHTIVVVAVAVVGVGVVVVVVVVVVEKEVVVVLVEENLVVVILHRIILVEDEVVNEHIFVIVDKVQDKDQFLDQYEEYDVEI
jgi:hypothetical protein